MVEPASIIMLATVLVVQIGSLFLQLVKHIKKSTCCGGSTEVEFRSAESIRKLDGTG